MPRHVLFVHHSAYPLFNPADRALAGGAELQLHLMATELARDPRFRVSFLVSSPAAPERERRDGVEIHAWRPRGGGGRRSPAEHLRYLRLLGRIGPDVLVQRGSAASTGILALWCRARGVRFVEMLASDIDLEPACPLPWGRGPYGRLQWRMHRLGLRLAHAVVVQHEGQRATLRARYGREGVLRPSAHRIPAAPEPRPGRFALWVSRCDPWKRPELFLDLAAGRPRDRFVMVCPPSDDAAYHAQTVAAARGRPNVELRGLEPAAAAEDLIRRSWVLVNTSTIEGFPNTFVQAWKHGTPVLSLGVDPDGALAGGAGLCAGGDPAALLPLLARLFDEPGLRAGLSARAHAHARAHHDIARVVEEDKRLLLALE